MLLFKSMPDVLFTEKLVALSGGHHHGEGAVQERIARMQRTRRRRHLRGRGGGGGGGSGGRPARQEARAGRVYCQQSRQGTSADALHEPGGIFR